MSSTAALRRQSDVHLVDRFVQRSGGLLQLKQAFTTTSSVVKLRTSLPTSVDNTYPLSRSLYAEFTISLPARYPFAAPVVKMDTPIYHPNVFTNGTVCLGTQWHASEGLDLFISRVLRLITYDALLVNLDSPANGGAANWYLRASTQHPAAFPTVARHAQAWLFDPRAEKIVLRCPQCTQSLRLPSGKSGVVACPKCQHEFETRT